MRTGFKNYAVSNEIRPMTLSLIVAGQALQSLPLQFSQAVHTGAGSVFLICGFGLVLGIRHATDADHIVALSTIISKQNSVKRAALIGSLWGLGHTLTILAVGSLIILFHVRIPTRLGLSMEFSVAIMLVVLGLLNLTGLMQRFSNRLTDAGRQVSLGSRNLVHGEHPNAVVRSMQQVGLYQCIRPFVVGLIHGLAGSAAVALLVLSTIHSPLWATAYLLIFGLGTIVGMMLMTTAVAVPLTYGSKRFTALNGYLAVTSGMVSLCFGLFLVYQLGFVGGLFRQHPSWTPH